MRRILTVLLTLTLLITITACGRTEHLSNAGVFAQERGESGGSISEPEQSGTDTSVPVEDGSISETEGIAESDIVQQEQAADNVLVVYFSRWGNTDYPNDVDATTSASIVIDEDVRMGTTEYVAYWIADEVGGDLHRIETVMPYTADFDELRDVNHDEMDRNYLPGLKESDLDIAGYDTVFVGYPVWAASVPQAVLSFLDEYDLSGKTVIPFCTHDGYGAGRSYQVIAEASHAAVSLDGIAIEAKDVPGAQNTIADWLADIGISGSQEENAAGGETAIHITIGDITLDGVLYDMALAEEIKAYFPLTVSMSGYGGREYYGGVDFYPENLEGGQRNFENGDITYCEAHHNMAIFYAQTDRPDLSVDVIPIGRVTSDLSIFRELESREEIVFSLAQ